MTIKQFIIENEVAIAKDRLAKLKAMGAPLVIINSQQKAVSDLEAGVLIIGGAVEKLDFEYTGFVVKTGNGGKKYIEFADGTRYFPNAKYGRYIA